VLIDRVTLRVGAAAASAERGLAGVNTTCAGCVGESVPAFATVAGGGAVELERAAFGRSPAGEVLSLLRVMLPWPFFHEVARLPEIRPRKSGRGVVGAGGEVFRAEVRVVLVTLPPAIEPIVSFRRRAPAVGAVWRGDRAGGP